MSTTPFGFLNIDKPRDWTSHDVVAKARRGLEVKKIGHAGTLDPLATGVLILCVGGATRLSDYVMHATKTYRARVHLGITTDTYDADGEITAQTDASHITREQVEAALTPFIGAIQQMPPMYSAIKQDGRKLYELAREGKTVERQPRPVRIDSLTIDDWQSPQFTLTVVCSAGTYVRSLAFDLGEALGVGAHLAALTRSASGRFTLDNAVTLDDLLAAADWEQHLIPSSVALGDYPRVIVSGQDADDLTHGRPIPRQDETPPTAASVAFAYRADGSLLAILEARGRRWQPRKVFK